jgi:hypothetical protein
MKLIKWELSLGVFEGILFGYRKYSTEIDKNVDHVFYILIFDICLSLFYE